MNKNLKTSLLSALFFTVITPQTTQPYYHYSTNHCADAVCTGLWIAGGITVAALGIQALGELFRWSDNDILTWAENGSAQLFNKYQHLRSARGITLNDLRVFGLRNNTSSGWSDRATAIKENSRLFPLHNANLVIQNDIEALLEFRKYLNDRGLAQLAIRHNFYYEITDLINDLRSLSDVIDTSFEYQEEEKLLQEKIDRIRQQRLDRERNQALHNQAHAQWANAQAIRENARATREATRNQQINTQNRFWQPNDIYDFHSPSRQWDIHS